MQSRTKNASVLKNRSYEFPALLLALALVMLTMLEYIQNRKWLILICCLVSGLIAGIALFRRKCQADSRLYFLLYVLHLLWLALGVIWVCSGKLFLREYSKQLFALPLTLYIFFLLPRKEDAVRRLLFLMSAAGAFYALLSIDIASIGLSRWLLNLIPGFGEVFSGFERGTRLAGIFSNPNISAGLLAICIFLSIYLLESAESRRQRVFAAAFAALQAETFLLNFSLGATGFFLLSVIVYLIFAGNRRSQVLLRMLEIALPTIVSVFISFRFFDAADGNSVIPLLAAILSAAACVALELSVLPKLEGFVEARSKAASGVLAAVLLLLIVYGVSGLLIRGSAALPAGQSMRRACYPAPGDYQLSIRAEGNVNVRVYSQNEREVIMHTQNVLYSGAASGAEFTVPEGSKVVYLSFISPQGAILRDAVLTGAADISLHLGYPLLPGFIATRLQGLRANENAIQRAAFFRDGMKIFRDHAILGAGLGSFETLLFGYQEFYYETKYVHNHYVQTLLDSGIIGFLLYLSMLAATAAALWRGRRKDGPYRSLHPALCAAFMMILLHSSMEVVMSTTVYLPYALTVFAISAICYGKPLENTAVRCASAAIPGLTAVVYAILIILNLTADSAVKHSTNSAVGFFNSLEYAAKADVFEKNDWMVSYIETCADTELSSYRPQANRYAEYLMNVPSNSLHQHLIRYYLVFRDYEKALLAAQQSARFNYSDSTSWNASFNYFAAALSEYEEDSDEILRCVRILNGDLLEYQSKLMESIELDAISKVIVAAAMNEQ